MTLHCNVISRWLGAHTKWSLILFELRKDLMLIFLPVPCRRLVFKRNVMCWFTGTNVGLPTFTMPSKMMTIWWVTPCSLKWGLLGRLTHYLLDNIDYKMILDIFLLILALNIPQKHYFIKNLALVQAFGLQKTLLPKIPFAVWWLCYSELGGIHWYVMHPMIGIVFFLSFFFQLHQDIHKLVSLFYDIYVVLLFPIDLWIISFKWVQGVYFQFRLPKNFWRSIFSISST